MSTSFEAQPQDFFAGVVERDLWDHPQALPSFLVREPIDRLAEDEVPIDELEDAYAVEALIWGGA